MRVYHLGTPHQAQTGCGEGRDARRLQSNPRPCGLERQTAVHSSPPGLGEHPRHLGWDNLQGITSPDIGLRSSLRANGLPRWLRVKNPPVMQVTWVRSLGREDPLEEGMAIHSSILAWRIPWAKEPGGYRPWQRAGH